MTARCSKRLAIPHPISASMGNAGVPVALDHIAVESVREDWVVEDRWWAGRPLRRRYLELVLVDGRNVVAFCDLVGGGWYAQPG